MLIFGSAYDRNFEITVVNTKKDALPIDKKVTTKIFEKENGDNFLQWPAATNRPRTRV